MTNNVSGRRGAARHFPPRSLVGRGGACCSLPRLEAGATARLWEQVTEGSGQWALREKSGTATPGEADWTERVLPRRHSGWARRLVPGPGPVRPLEPGPGPEPRLEEAAGLPGRRKVAFCQTPGAALALSGLAKDRDPGGIIVVADYPSQAEVLYALVLIP